MSTFNNNVQLIGHLGGDLEMKTLQGGQLIGRVSLATNERFKDKEGNLQEKTQWHRLLIWGKMAETMNNILQKGSHVGIRGKLQYGQFENKEGHTVYTTDIVVNQFEPLLSSVGKKETQEAVSV